MVEIVNEQGNGFGRVTGSFEGEDADAAEFERRAVIERSEFVLCLGFRAEVDGGADAVAELQMSGDEVGVEMREEYMLDLEIVLGRELDIAANVALRIDDGSVVGLLVSDDVRGVRKTGQIELLEDHAGIASVGYERV